MRIADHAAPVPFRERLTCTIREAGAALGVGRCTIYKLLDQGRIDSVKLDKRRLVRVPSLLRLIGEPAE